MPQNGFSVGRDTVLTVVTPQGPLTINQISGFSAKQGQTTDRRKALNGKTSTLVTPDGWSGTLSVDRRGGELDAYFAQAEADFYAGIDQPAGTITQTITEPNGVVSQYRFTGVVLSYENAGSWGGDKAVEQSISWTAERRLKIA